MDLATPVTEAELEAAIADASLYVHILRGRANVRPEPDAIDGGKREAVESVRKGGAGHKVIVAEKKQTNPPPGQTKTQTKANPRPEGGQTKTQKKCNKDGNRTGYFAVAFNGLVSVLYRSTDSCFSFYDIETGEANKVPFPVLGKCEIVGIGRTGVVVSCNGTVHYVDIESGMPEELRMVGVKAIFQDPSDRCGFLCLHENESSEDVISQMHRYSSGEWSEHVMVKGGSIECLSASNDRLAVVLYDSEQDCRTVRVYCRSAISNVPIFIEDFDDVGEGKVICEGSECYLIDGSGFLKSLDGESQGRVLPNTKGFSLVRFSEECPNDRNIVCIGGTTYEMPNEWKYAVTDEHCICIWMSPSARPDVFRLDGPPCDGGVSDHVFPESLGDAMKEANDFRSELMSHVSGIEKLVVEAQSLQTTMKECETLLLKGGIASKALCEKAFDVDKDLFVSMAVQLSDLDFVSLKAKLLEIMTLDEFDLTMPTRIELIERLSGLLSPERSWIAEPLLNLITGADSSDPFLEFCLKEVSDLLRRKVITIYEANPDSRAAGFLKRLGHIAVAFVSKRPSYV